MLFHPDTMNGENMSDNTYHFTGRVIPERANISSLPVKFEVSAGDDVAPGLLHIQIYASQVFGRLVCPTPIKNELSARNLVEDAVRSILDAKGFVYARGYSVEIVQFFHPDPRGDRVFGVDVQALEVLATSRGLTEAHLHNLMSTPSSLFFRRALGDFREALLSPMDTGFFCYRAIESLMQEHASRNATVTDRKERWENFRHYYGVAEQQIMEIKDYADPVRHGNGMSLKEITSADRMRLFESAWGIAITVFLRAHADKTPSNPPPEWVNPISQP
jgi:hypothetical protein